ncbi:MAG: hypothetical protein WC254_07195 [Candidatus Woesearchaeota archaeon]|jgi:hypothetical protein
MVKIIHKIRHHLHKFHKIRKRPEYPLPTWKHKWNIFNETKLYGLEKFVEWMLPWLVILLLFIIVGEFAHVINYFQWAWLERVALFFEEYKSFIDVIDKVITGFFVVDLYFNFFKKKTFWSFLKTSFVDILAVAPLGLIFRVGGLSEAQAIIHVTSDVEKEAGQFIKEGEEITKIAKDIAKGEEVAKISRLTRMEKVAVEVEKLPRALRLYRVTDLGKKKKQKRKKR